MESGGYEVDVDFAELTESQVKELGQALGNSGNVTKFSAYSTSVGSHFNFKREDDMAELFKGFLKKYKKYATEAGAAQPEKKGGVQAVQQKQKVKRQRRTR